MLLRLLVACCGQTPPAWGVLDPVTTAVGVETRVDLSEYVTDDANSTHAFTAVAGEGVSAVLSGSTLTLTGAPDFEGFTRIDLSVTDACGQVADTSLSVEVVADDGSAATGCRAEIRTDLVATEIAVAGSFNEWSTTAALMTKDGEEWVATLYLEPGAYAYKLVADGVWSCDAGASEAVCEADQSWDPTCPPGGNNCNSVLVVPDCSAPQLSISSVKIDRNGNGIRVSGRADTDVTNPWATLDGDPVDAWTERTFVVDADGLSEGRHTLRIGADGARSLYVPFWTDEDFRWDEGLLYFVFVDRFADGDPGAPGEGADVDYLGGDWQGALDRLDDLAGLGVTTLWLTAPIDNAEGDWPGQCNATYAGYHGYWPDSDGLEEHFGDEADFRALVSGAHDRGMRVMVDWVANHVHSDHPIVVEHPEWFNDRHICEEDDDGDGVTNWDQRPETCWFASYLPDLDYHQLAPTDRFVEDAVAFVEEFEIDGYRVDAVKHLPHSVVVDLQARIAERIEHSAAGGDEDFRTLGETFDGAEKIASYVDERQLDAQFDFPLYFAIVSAFARDEIGLSDGEGSLADTFADSQVAYGDALMGTFLGNHDVTRFIAHAAGEVDSLYGDGACDDEGDLVSSGTPPGWSEPYDRLALAWTFLLTSEGQPLVYYGDEIGLPGYADPDNRQGMRWDGEWSEDEARVRAHVATLGQARREHPALSHGTRTTWWENEAEVWAYARVGQDDEALVILNRGEDERELTNGLSFAGLSQGIWEDVLTGSTYASDGDSLTVRVPALGARVLVLR